MKITPVILAGGLGTRLWPISREDQPKQFLPLINSNSLFQDTLFRFKNSSLYRYPLIVGNEGHRFTIQNQLKEINWQASEIILEPFGKNTAPALTLASLRLKRIIDDYSDDDELILVLPADHYIEDEMEFENVIRSASSFALSGRIVTFGITPNQPQTGYGYIAKGKGIKFEESVDEVMEMPSNLSRFDCFEIEKFIEKPELEIAESYIKSGNYYWNSGIFMMKPSVWIEAITTFNKNLFDNCGKSISLGEKDEVFYRPEPKAFEKCENIAIDYAVMEKIGVARQTCIESSKSLESCVFGLDVGWSDVGSWISLADILREDGSPNVVRGDVYTDSTSKSIIIATNRMVVTVGIEDLVIVETGDAVLVVDKKSDQLVKNVVNKLKIENRHEQKNHLKIQRPWGSFEVLEKNESYQVKKLLINPDSAISLQFHEHRSEHWVVVSGEVEVVKGESKFVLRENQSTYVSKGEVHRLSNSSGEIVEIIEVQTGSIIKEEDITRIKDDYNR